MNTAVIQFLQQIDFPLVVVLMKAVTFLGNEDFYLLFVPLLFWCWHKDVALPLVLLLVASLVLNVILKNYFALPRPPENLHLIPAEGYGFPSGHAQGTIVLGGFLAWRLRTYHWPVILIFMVGLSRVYLGVHSPGDVIGGWCIGFAILFIGLRIIRYRSWKELVFPPLPTALLLGLGGALLAGLYPQAAGAMGGGLLAGIGGGLVLEKAYLDFNPRSRWWKQVLKALLGLGGMLILGWILDLLPGVGWGDWFRYLLVGLWIGLGAPWIFVRLGL